MVSIVIPTHNRVDLLCNAVESVLKQSYEDWEMIIVDDGSTDGTEEYLKGLEDERISFHRVPLPVGGNSARNKGIALSKGDYIAFLDDDDQWMETKLEKQMKLFKNEDTGLVYTGTEIIYPHYNIRYTNIPRYRGDLSKDILITNLIGTTSTVVLRKEILEISGAFDDELKAKQDYDLWIRVCMYCRVDVVEEPLVKYYFRRGEGQVSDDIEKYESASKRIDEKYSEYIDELDENLKIERQMRNCMSLANRCHRAGRKREARSFMVKALRLKFSFKTLGRLLMTFFDYKWTVHLRKIVG